MGKPSRFPEGYHTATPYMIIKEAAPKPLSLQESVGLRTRKGSDAFLRSRMGRSGTAEIKIGDSQHHARDGVYGPQWARAGTTVTRWLTGEILSSRGTWDAQAKLAGRRRVRTG